MTAITLPACPIPNEAQPFLVDAGGELTPFLPGGAVIRVNRLGSKIGCRFTMPEMDIDDGRVFATRLMRGKAADVIMNWPLFDLDPGTPPDPRIQSASTGTVLIVKGLGASYLVREGQPFSVLHDEHRYMHFATGDAVANGSGIAGVGVWPPTRTTYLANDVVEIVQPKIEGRVSPGDELAWTVALDNTYSIPFTVVERR